VGAKNQRRLAAVFTDHDNSGLEVKNWKIIFGIKIGKLFLE
jgi:hypothetical protein